METISYIHFKNFVHGNLSPRNIYYNGSKIILMGFENSLTQNSDIKYLNLDPLLLPPEFKNLQTANLDCWCVG